MRDQKHAIYADNKTVYVANNFRIAQWWLENELLPECKPGYIYAITAIDDETERKLQEADQNGFIFLAYPRIISERR